MGVVSADGTAVFGVKGSILDVDTGTYSTIPTLPDGIGDQFGQGIANGDGVVFSVRRRSQRCQRRPRRARSRLRLAPADEVVAPNGVDDLKALDAAIAVLGIDPAGAPDGALDLGDGRFCGYEVHDLTRIDSANVDGRACFAAALADGSSAMFIMQLTSTEGDPIAWVWRTGDGAGHEYIDSTRDAFGSGEWSERACSLIAAEGSQPFGCAGDGLTPASTTVVAPTEGATATWALADEAPVSSDDTIFVQVTRLGCNDGVTGDVLDPVVQATDTEIVVSISVAALPAGDHTCPGNDAVPVTVVLGEPIGNRRLVDGACRSTEASGTSFCEADDGIRWSPGGSTDTPTTDIATFCDPAVSLLRSPDLGAARELIADLRAVDTAGLTGEQRGTYLTGITALEERVGSPDGYDTVAVTDAVNEICGTELSQWFATP